MTLQRALGAAILCGLLAGVLALALSPGFRADVGRVLGLVVHDAFASAAGDAHAAVPTAGLRRGDPIYLDARAGGLRPVAYVTAVEEDGLRYRVVPGEHLPAGLELVRIEPPRGLGDALRTAVPPEVRTQLEAELSREVRQLIEDGVLPELEARLPGFLARVDPREDPSARAVLDALGAEILARLRPLGDELAAEVAAAVKRRFDFLERVGLLWDVLRGDADGLREQVTPVAIASAEAWWLENRDAVLTEVGEAVVAKIPDLRTWVLESVLPAARDELAAPILESQGPAMERAAERLFWRVADLVVEAPEGGFRLRFRTVLRTRLLEKDEPLLLFTEPGS